MNQLLEALGRDIKPSSKKDRWIAKCPVHGDKDFAMSIKINRDNSVMAHCHACGANGLDLYKYLGLRLDELFGGKKLESTYIPQEIIDNYTIDKIVIIIYKSDKQKRKYMSLQDNRRHKLAVARIEGIERKFPHIK